MKERPILFSAPMVRAILSGTKTQTRRVVKQVPHWQHCGRDIMEWGLSDCYTDKNGKHWLDIQTDVDDNSHDRIYCPYGAPGDRLWVRETFADNDQSGINPADSGYVYRATDPDWETMEGWKWKPSIFMPRNASRVTLEIEAVRVERLQDISEADAVAEGIERQGGERWKDYLGAEFGWMNPVGSYRTLWESINGPGSWDANPFCWVLSFKRI